MFHHAIRVTLPYQDCSGIISRWSDRSARVVVYQHDADEEVSKTHVHLGLYGCEVKAEALKRMWPDAPGKGNEFWSFKEASVEAAKYITYMSKGILRAKYTKNFSQEELENSRLAWVEPVKADKVRDNSEYIVNKVVDSIKSQFVYHRLTDEERYERVECSVDTLLKLVRTQSFKMLWGEHRRVPHASHYKIVAGTAFMRLCEHYGCFDEGVSAIQELWY